MGIEYTPLLNPKELQSQQDYISALEVIAEVSDIVIDEKLSRPYEEVIIAAEQLTYASTPEHAVDEAEAITYDTAVRRPGLIVRQAMDLTHDHAPDRIVAAAEYLARYVSERLPEEIVKDAEKITKKASEAEAKRTSAQQD